MKYNSDILKRVKDLVSCGMSRKDLIKIARGIGISAKELWKMMSDLEMKDRMELTMKWVHSMDILVIKKLIII